jgi:photosystem II stability/assembly factor-like uncharacterized protein
MTRTNRVLHLATHSGWYRFEPSGEEWRQADRALTYWQMSCIEVAPDDPRKVYLGTEHSGLFVSANGGEDWRRAEPNVPCLTMAAVLALPGRLLVGTMPAALYITAGNGDWHELPGVRRGAAGGTFPPNPDLAPRTRVLESETAPGGRIYAGIEVGGILASDDDGLTWKPLNHGLSDPDLHQILASKSKPGLVVAASGEGVSRSTDRGAHWEKVTPAGSRSYGNALTEDVDGNIYLGITEDRPRTWTRPGRAKSAIFKSPDGANWHLLSEAMSGGVMDMVPGPEGTGVLVATADGEIVSVSASGDARTVASGLPAITAMAWGS